MFQVRDSNTGELRAAKRVPKDLVSDHTHLRRELELLLTLDHPNVVRLFEWFESKDYIWLIQELFTGGEALDLVGIATSREAFNVVRQILLGIAYLHDRGVIHRDMKLENCMFQIKVVKIIDLGLSGIIPVHGGQMPPTLAPSTPVRAGTSLYFAPELLKTLSYTKKCDIWSVGILTFILLTGNHPFWKDLSI